MCVLPASLLCAAPQPERNIGIEGQVAATLPRPDYRPKPLDDRTELILRLDNMTGVTNGQYRYDFHYMGLEPGRYNLADYLVRPDGSRPAEIEGVQVEIRSLLPENSDGRLNPYAPQPFPWIGGYRVMLVTLGLAWCGGIAGFTYAFRKKRPVVAAPVEAPEPSFAERLRPLVEAAAAGKLSLEGKAELERLMMGFWRQKLDLPELRMAEALARLKAHAQAGELLRALERWLHRPGGVSATEVNLVLEPYRAAPAPVAVTAGGAA